MEIDRISFSIQNNIEILKRIMVIAIINTIILSHQIIDSIFRTNNTDIVWITIRSTSFQDLKTIKKSK